MKKPRFPGLCVQICSEAASEELKEKTEAEELATTNMTEGPAHRFLL